jgi:hypothetical protein
MRVRLVFSLMLALLAVGLQAGCGKAVSLGAGPPAASDASDVATQGDADDDGGGPANACVAAGGTCLSISATCDVPGDPALRSACGDPLIVRCCMARPDAAPVDRVVGSADAGTD